MQVNRLKIQKTKKKIHFDFHKAILTPYLLILVGLIVLPMAIILFYSVVDQTSEFPIFSLNFSNYYYFLTTKEFVGALLKSLYLALITTLICVLVAYPISYYIARRKPKTQAMLILLITAPMWINMLLRTLAVKQLFEGPIFQLMSLFGAQENLLGTNFAVIFGMVINYVPFMVLPIYTILQKLDYKLIEASTDLGASRGQTFRNVILPLSIPGVLSGITIVFLSAATTIVISKYLGDGKYLLIGNIIEKQFIENARWSYGSAISIILLAIVMIIMWLINKLDRTSKGDSEV